MRFLSFLAVALVSVSCLSAADQRPNVLLICVDDLKPMLGCYGATTIQTPQLDRLAERGVVFERAYCNQAVCAPSRHALLTGRRPTTLGIYDLGTRFRLVAPDLVTLPQHFKQHGWRTEAMGKVYHVSHGNTDDPASWSVPHWPARASGYALPENRPPPATDAAAGASDTDIRGTATESADVPDSTYADGRIAGEAIARLTAAAGRPGQPFFIAVGFHRPHLPFVAPKKYWDLYSEKDFQPHPRQQPPRDAPSFAGTTWGELRRYKDMPQTGPLTDAQQLRLIHGYHASVSYMDAQAGRVLDALDRLGLATNTIVILWGDHGWHLGDHGYWCKHTNYEEATRIPWIMAAPGHAPAGGRSSALVESVDLYPTLCELAGLPMPAGLDGASFAAALKHPAEAKTKEAVFHAYPRSVAGQGQVIGRAVRTERFRLVEWKRPGAAADTALLELYDYQTDPGETQNLAAAQPAQVAQLRALLASQPEAKPQFRAPTNSAAAARPATDRAALFQRRDLDNDGQLTRAESLGGQNDPEAAAKRFDRFDLNRDGVLSREEFINGPRNAPARDGDSSPP